VHLFGVWRLPNPIGKWEELAFIAKWVHIISGYVLLAAIIGHVGLVLRHQLFLKDGLLMRMLPQKKS
jgi:cytochrome b561